MATNKNLSNLIINKVKSQAVYDSMKATGLVNEDELYLVNDTGSGSIDVSSVNGLDTYLTNTGCVRFLSGSYQGTASSVTPSKLTTVDKLKTNGRKMILAFTPYVLYLNDKTLHQNESATTTIIGSYGQSNITYYSAYLEGNILYIAGGHDFSSQTYRWEIADCELF